MTTVRVTSLLVPRSSQFLCSVRLEGRLGGIRSMTSQCCMRSTKRLLKSSTSLTDSTSSRNLDLSSAYFGHLLPRGNATFRDLVVRTLTRNEGIRCGLEKREDPVVSTRWLASCLADVNILDIRGHTVSFLVEEGVEKSDYKSDYDEYLEGHIPGAVFFNWLRDGVEEQALAPVQLVDDSDEFAIVMEQKGISTEKPVVVYDRGDGLLAPRLWWALVRYGHPAVHILDGGLKKWADEGRPLQLYEPCTLKVYADYKPAHVYPSLVASWETIFSFVSKSTTHKLVESQNPKIEEIVIVDARDTAQYEGLIRRSKRGGRVPGAISIPRRSLIEPNGTFKSIDAQRQVFLEAGLDPSRSITLIAYCNGGIASCSILLAWHRIQGSGSWANYDGSWNEWGNRDDLPVEMLRKT